MPFQYHHALVGGTFDRFHQGHRQLLTTAFEQSEKVTIGIATRKLFADKEYAQFIEDFQTREFSIIQFLSEKSFEDRADIIPIRDIYGTSVEDTSADAIFVTEGTKENALKINEEREKRSLPQLAVITVPFVPAEDGEIISSARIRGGLIDREGHSYVRIFERQESFTLPDAVREEARSPIGPIYRDMQEVLAIIPRTLLIAVGDIVAASASQAGRPAEINIIDGKTRRANLEPTDAISFFEMTRRETDNPAGTITKGAAKSILAAIADYETKTVRQLINVSGEEDLLAIPAILFAPLGSVVIYGQFDKGIVVVDVSEHNKKRIYDLFRKFQ